MEKPTLLILAAGMGSRYGSLKQMDGVGPGGETIMDYSIYDAIRGGFGRVVFVIRNSFAEEFKSVFSRERYQGKIEVDYVMQELENLPAGFPLNPERTKPWGTNHAIMMAADTIAEPFAVINADDYYGRHSFAVLGDFLSKAAGTENKYCMVGFQLGNTLSELGAVSRGACSVSPEGNLLTVVERTHIERKDNQIAYKTDSGELVELPENTIVSMNMWGFTPDYFRHSDSMFGDFLRQNLDNLKAEFFIPMVVNSLVSTNTATLKVLGTDSEWFGVTYQGDRPKVVAKLAELVAAGEYPAKLWS
jgi:hypothetical protein